jgi:hypothetical protein
LQAPIGKSQPPTRKKYDYNRELNTIILSLINKLH